MFVRVARMRCREAPGGASRFLSVRNTLGAFPFPFVEPTMRIIPLRGIRSWWATKRAD
jgi:hypothetical protein